MLVPVGAVKLHPASAPLGMSAVVFVLSSANSAPSSIGPCGSLGPVAGPPHRLPTIKPEGKVFTGCQPPGLSVGLHANTVLAAGTRARCRQERHGGHRGER